MAEIKTAVTSLLPPYRFLIDLWDRSTSEFGKIAKLKVEGVGDLKKYEEFGHELMGGILNSDVFGSGERSAKAHVGKRESPYGVFQRYDLLGVDYQSLSRRYIIGGFGEVEWEPFFHGLLLEKYSDTARFLSSVYKGASFPFLGLLRKNWLFVCFEGQDEEKGLPFDCSHVVRIPWFFKDSSNVSDRRVRVSTKNALGLDQLDLDGLVDELGDCLANRADLMGAAKDFYRHRELDEVAVREVIQQSSRITLALLQLTGKMRCALFVPTFVEDIRIGGMVFMGENVLSQEECDFLELVSKSFLTPFRMLEEIATQKNIRLEKEKDDLRSFLLHRLSHNVRHPLNDAVLKAKEVIDVASRMQQDLKDSMHMVDHTLAALVANMPEDVPLNKQEDNVDEFLEDIKWGQRNELPEGRRLIFEKDRVKNFFFRFDASVIREILRNLIKNSAKYANGDITIRAYPQSDNLVLDVLDIGPGIPEDLRPILFEPKFTDTSSQEGGERGRGIGLWICSQLMRIHGVGISEIAPEVNYRDGTFFRIIVGEPTKKKEE